MIKQTNLDIFNIIYGCKIARLSTNRNPGVHYYKITGHFTSAMLFTYCTHLSCIKAGATIPPKPMMHIAYSPYFYNIYKFHPYFRKMYTFPPISAKFMFFCLVYVFFIPPYFDHDAFMHHALHVLDALVLRGNRRTVWTDWEIKSCCPDFHLYISSSFSTAIFSFPEAIIYGVKSMDGKHLLIKQEAGQIHTVQTKQ